MQWKYMVWPNLYRINKDFHYRCDFVFNELTVGLWSRRTHVSLLSNLICNFIRKTEFCRCNLLKGGVKFCLLAMLLSDWKTKEKPATSSNGDWPFHNVPSLVAWMWIWQHVKSSSLSSHKTDKALAVHKVPCDWSLQRLFFPPSRPISFEFEFFHSS